MEQLTNLVLPIFSVMLCGYLAGRLKILGQESSYALNSFVYYFAMPLLLFKAVAGTDLRSILDLSFILVVLIPQFVVHAAWVLIGVWWFKRPLGELMIEGLAASWANTVYMGFPLALTAFGDAAIPALVIVAIIQPPIFFIATMVILDYSAGRDARVSALQALASSLKSFLRNPATIAIVAGGVVSGFSIDLVPAVSRFVEILSPAAAPCALFAIGLFLSMQKISSDLPMVSLLTFIKLILCPLLVWLCAMIAASWGFVQDPLWIKVALLLAATPTGTMVFVIAQKYRLAQARSSSAILLSSVLSVVTISVLLNWL